jgi:hypothetical protein
VWNWKGTIGKTVDAAGARVNEKGTIPDLDKIAWTGRQVYVLFDSDTTTNDKVAAARRGLAAELKQRGARVAAPDLPVLNGLDKMGFDDLLAAWGHEKVIGWLETARDAGGHQRDEQKYPREKVIGRLETAREAALPPDPNILDDVHDFLGRFVSYPHEHAHVAHTLWTAHTHLMEKWESTPRLAFLSPEPGSGKTRALEVSEPIVPRPVEAVNATSAYIFRKISDPGGRPTILFDEIDTIFGPKAREHEELRGVLNAGHRRGAVAGRCVIRGKSVETEELPAFCAVALAGLGNLPDTILTRSVVIKMRRRAPGENIEPWRRKIHAPEGNKLRDRLAAWSRSVTAHVPDNPVMPEGISDRPADVWEPLLAVAEVAGGTWPERARVTAVTLVTRSQGDQGSLRVQLLGDIRSIFNTDTNKEKSSVPSTDLINALLSMDESLWTDLKGKPLDGRKLAAFLKPYDIGPKVIKKGDVSFRGYEKHDFLDAWSRYLQPEESPSTPSTPEESVTCVTSVTVRSGSGDSCNSSPLQTCSASVTDVLEGQGTPRGYLRDDFADAAARYLSPNKTPETADSPLSKCNSDTNRSQSGDNSLFQCDTDTPCVTSENGTNPAPRATCVTVSLPNPQNVLLLAPEAGSGEFEVIDVD